MTFGYHPDDLAALRRATGKSAEELGSNRQFLGEYYRWLSRYHLASGSSGPLGPLAIAILLGVTKSYKAPSETIDVVPERPTDWTTVSVGSEIVVRFETSPPYEQAGAFIAVMQDGYLGVRLSNESAARMVQARLVKLAPPPIPGVDTSQFTKVADSVFGRDTLASVKKIEKQAREARAAEAEAKKAAVAAAAAEIKEAPALPATEVEAVAAETERRQLALGEDSNEPESEAADDTVRESEWLWADPGHKAIVEYDGDFPDAEFVRVGDNADPNDLKLVLWIPKTERSIQISEHKVQAKTPIKKAEPVHAAADEL